MVAGRSLVRRTILSAHFYIFTALAKTSIAETRFTRAWEREAAAHIPIL
jgi:hypothetical protein